MKLEKITIKNFKSLADVTITPSNLTVIIGPNGAGKTNLANAFSFLKEVYANGLETAVQRSGGFDNIVFASKENEKITIEFSITFTTTTAIFYGQVRGFFKRGANKEIMHPLNIDDNLPITIIHKFSLISTTINIVDSTYKILQESYSVRSGKQKILSIEKGADKIPKAWVDEDRLPLNDIFTSFEEYASFSGIMTQELMSQVYPLRIIVSDIKDYISKWAVYQLFPNAAKAEGVPTPNPTLSLYGENLPVLVDYIKKNEKPIWENIFSTMKKVIPSLLDISTGYLYNKTIGLFFQEEDVSRPWNAEEVSDGTILTLAMLCSVNDPRNTLIFIEEPENSLHPWILRELLQNFKNIAEEKPILVTTHSPTLIDMVSPNDIWCISKIGRETQLNRLTDVASELQSDWEGGKYKISDYLDSGLVPQAIPGGSI